MPVQFKFRGEKAFRSLLNVTTPCTLQRVKNAVYEQARISDVTTDLFLDDASTGRPLEPKVLLVEDILVQVLVRRTPKVGDPGATAGLLAIDDDFGDAVVVKKPEKRMIQDDDEDLAIDRIVQQHDLSGLGLSASSTAPAMRFSRSYNAAAASEMKQHYGYDSKDGDEAVLEEPKEPPPENYTCHRCGSTGSHWIWECPTNDDPDHFKKVRPAKGIPRQFLRKVASIEEGQELSAGGVTFTIPGHSGHYIYDHEAPLEEIKLRVGETMREKVTAAFSAGARGLEDSLKCPLCHQMFRQAVLAPCCGATFCSDCAIDRLAHSSVDNSHCPACKKEVFVHELIANEDIRRQVDQVTRASKVAAIAAEKQEKNPIANSFELTAALKDRVNRPKKYAEEAAAGGSAAPMLALTDASQPSAASRPAEPSWQPLGFGPLLSKEQLSWWQHAIRSAPSWDRAKEQFEAWQRQVREAAMPPPVAYPAPQDWQHVVPPMHYYGAPPPMHAGAFYPDPSHERDRKRARRERRDHGD